MLKKRELGSLECIDWHDVMISSATQSTNNLIVIPFYNEEDNVRGYIQGKDRQDNDQKFGLLSVSIGIVSSVNQSITHVAQIGEIGAELKTYAKSFENSKRVRNQRKDL